MRPGRCDAVRAATRRLSTMHSALVDTVPLRPTLNNSKLSRCSLPLSKLPPLSAEENRALRERYLSPALKMHYTDSIAGPIKVASAQGQYLFDSDGNRYLDCVNNVRSALLPAADPNREPLRPFMDGAPPGDI